MYTGTDFLISKNMDMYVCEVNMGLPGGAQEYDFIHRNIFGKPSGVFLKIEKISRDIFNKPFKKYIRELPFFEDLKKLKVWMDGQGPAPLNVSGYIRLEDKWVQYQVLSTKYHMMPTELFNKKNHNIFRDAISNGGGFVLKRRFGRGGRGQIQIKTAAELDKLMQAKLADNFYIYQPYLESSVKCNKHTFKLSIRVLSFAGQFICMYANVSKGITSNHGYIFYVNPANKFGVRNDKFTFKAVNKKAWEAYIFYGKDTPGYLYHNLNEELVSDSVLNIPEEMYDRMVSISSSISSYYMEMDISNLPRCYLEEKSFKELPGFTEI